MGLSLNITLSPIISFILRVAVLVFLERVVGIAPWKVPWRGEETGVRGRTFAVAPTAIITLNVTGRPGNAPHVSFMSHFMDLRFLDSNEFVLFSVADFQGLVVNLR